ncbi:hypothetical protein GXB84_02065 [Stenotrophomonas acidaminiphila]|uniref:hypothetical protein n=1 Tax=Stenotrophomonas acidaminiphila TaxID=128780 RepID=UPI001375541A|nr:hypothetical protein [Stenotrophomonas acidaminiphila]NCT86115.1 hypothetical protein [Stenotrophomonas acidaminiphila]
MALIHAKTAAGRREIEDRGLRLAPALRSVLLLVDGQRDSRELLQMAQGLRAPEDALEQLLALGLIEVVGGNVERALPVPVTTQLGDDPLRYQQLRDWMAESVRRHLGLKGYLIQLKIERSRSAVGLEQLWPEVAAALGKAKSPAFASRWLEETRALVLA